MLGTTLSACYSGFGWRRDTTTVDRHIIETQQIQVPAPDLSTNEVEAHIEGDELHATVERHERCRLQEEITYSETERTHRELPVSYWVAGGGSLALTGVGTYLLANGRQLAAATEAIELGGPDVEEDRDLAKLETTIGISLISVGGALLVASVVDLLLGRDSEVPLGSSVDLRELGVEECGVTPAEGVAISIQGGCAHAAGATDENGTVIIPLLRGPFTDGPLESDFVDVSCADCARQRVPIPTRISAIHVISRGAYSEMTAWLSEHGGAPEAPEVQEAINEAVDRVMSTHLPGPCEAHVDESNDGSENTRLGFVYREDGGLAVTVEGEVHNGHIENPTSTVYMVDETGRPLEIRSEVGSTTLEYDNDGRVTQAVFRPTIMPSEEGVTTYSYRGAPTRCAAPPQFLGCWSSSREDAFGSTLTETYRYDRDRRLVETVRTFDNGTHRTRHSYDSAGNIVRSDFDMWDDDAVDRVVTYSYECYLD